MNVTTEEHSEPEVAVKALEWTRLSTGWIAHTSFHAYEIVTTDRGFMATYANRDFAWGEEDAMKVAAQTDYERRIRSCIIPITVKGWREIDLSKGVGSDHSELSADKQYIVKIHGGWFFGRFSRQWYGWSFNNWGSSGCQFDKPGTNSSTWERIIEIDPERLFSSVSTHLENTE